MNHSYIDDNGVIERYVTRRLGPQEAQDFEIHMLDCQRCIDEIRVVTLLRHGLEGHAAAPPDRTSAPPAGRPGHWLADILIGHSGLAAAAMLLIALLPAAAVYWTVGSATADRPSLVQNNGLVRGGAKLLAMAPVRSVGERPSYQLTLGESPAPVLLLLELDPQGCDAFAVDLHNAGGALLWSGTGLRPRDSFELPLAVEAARLEPDDYRFDVRNGDGCAAPGALVASYGLRVRP